MKNSEFIDLSLGSQTLIGMRFLDARFWSRHWADACRPKGTLDKEETLLSLLDMARLTILAMESAPVNQLGMRQQVMTNFVKWLPPVPPQLTTNTKAERDYVKKKVDAYVEEMNKGENTLGRQFLQSWQLTPMDMRPNVRQMVADFKRNLEASSEANVR